ncbi:MAG TPA: dihydrodipicolinate synthase family protein, partial [Acidimicrobiia bacterium]
AELGADAALVITPHYFTKGFAQPAAQIRHYLAVAEASPVPVMLYNFPLNTGINLEADTVAKIAEHPNVVGIKDSSGNIPRSPLATPDGDAIEDIKEVLATAGLL